MKKHEILSPQSRAILFDPPTDPAAIVRHYTLSRDDLALISRHRRASNRLGCAVQLVYLRFPGRTLGIEEIPPADVLAFIAGQLGVEREIFSDYALRQETRWEHCAPRLKFDLIVHCINESTGRMKLPIPNALGGKEPATSQLGTARLRAQQELSAKAEEEARLRADLEARLEAEQSARLKAEEDASANADEWTRLKADFEARVKAEQQARLRAQQELSAKAEEKARLRADFEARVKADHEALIKARQEASAKAEEWIRLRDDLEARLEAEQSARLKTEEEASANADEWTRLRDDFEARVKAEQEAGLRAQQELSARAEEEGRLRSELETRLQVDSEASALVEKQVPVWRHDESANSRQLSLDLFDSASLAAVFSTPTFDTVTVAIIEYTRKSLESGSAFVEKLLGAKSFGTAIHLHCEYVNTSHADFITYLTKIGELNARLGKEAFRRRSCRA